MVSFRVPPKHGGYFEGFYFKHQGRDGSLALIPAFHRGEDGAASASIQAIWEGGAHYTVFPGGAFQCAAGTLDLAVGDCRFSDRGLRVALSGEGFSLSGDIRYGALTPLRYDVMGPFRALEPVMQCYHGVASLRHELSGYLLLNGRVLDFSGGVGYIEADRGRSFPRDYLWTQCCWDGESVMLSIADIPLGPGRFRGCICTILHAGRELRLATYLGARVERYGPEGAEVRQGKYRLEVQRLDGEGQDLRAPARGAMSRTIREGLCCRVRYRLRYGERLLFDHTDGRASFEWSDERGF